MARPPVRENACRRGKAAAARRKPRRPRGNWDAPPQRSSRRPAGRAWSAPASELHLSSRALGSAAEPGTPDASLKKQKARAVKRGPDHLHDNQLLGVAVLERSAQDVAERSARIRRTVSGHGFLFL